MAKSDEYLKVLQEATKVAGIKWWPKYVYHYTDINNAINILEDEKLYSRNRVNDRMVNENAGMEILNQTEEEIFDYVRFYFRPKTPTQYRNEGFLPKNYRQYNQANVPVPIFFAFEAKDMLAMEETKFSEIALANTGNHLTSDINDFKRFDFSKIYSEGRYREGENLTPYRRAELVVPNECDLRFLKHIWCRSNAEYMSLCMMLKQKNIYDKYKDIIGVKENETGLFFKESVYINRVNLYIDKAELTFKNEDKVKNSNMDIKFVLVIGNDRFESETVHKLYSRVNFNSNKQFLIKQNDNKYIFQIYFDECLVFMNQYSHEEQKLNCLPY